MPSEIVTPDQLYPAIDREEAKQNLFFDEIPERSDSFYFDSVDKSQVSEISYFTPTTVPESPDIFWSEAAADEPRGFILVQ